MVIEHIQQDGYYIDKGLHKYLFILTGARQSIFQVNSWRYLIAICMCAVTEDSTCKYYAHPGGIRNTLFQWHQWPTI